MRALLADLVGIRAVKIHIGAADLADTAKERVAAHRTLGRRAHDSSRACVIGEGADSNAESKDHDGQVEHHVVE